MLSVLLLLIFISSSENPLLTTVTMAVLLWLFVASLHLKQGSCQESKIDPTLRAKLATGERVNIMVSFTRRLHELGLKRVRDDSRSQMKEDRVFRAHNMRLVMEELSMSCQWGVLEILDSRSSSPDKQFRSYQSIWTSNRLFVREASAALIETIAKDGEVAKVEVEPVLRIPKGKASNEKGGPPPPEFPGWNVNKTQAPEAWAALNGSTGEGVVVGVIDTGVRHTHYGMQGRWREDHGWYDPINGTTVPFDDQGHGTKVTGVIAASGFLGVAPGVQYIACKACDATGDCPFGHLSACLAFMACPTLPDGSDRDCSKAPRVINVSIGDVHGSQIHKEDLESLREAGIIPVFGVGNDGPKCSTVASPGELDLVIGVGATNIQDHVWMGSSVGPAFDGRVKPDLVAPGLGVWTTWGGPDADDGNALTKGTSIACPHVTAVVALLLVRQPELTFEQAYSLLTENTQREGLGVPSMEVPEDACPQETVDKVPNNHFGWGRLNALRTVEAQTKLLASLNNV